MVRNSSPLAAVLGVVMGCACLPLHAKTDFNVVGREMAGMLQNSHYARIQFNADLSAKILSDYLTDLDPARLYFTQQDIDAFEKKYGRRLHELLIKGRCMEPANEIYKVFSQRVKERVDYAKKLLKTEKFSFESDQVVMRTRKGADWPTSQQAAEEIWKRQIEEALLSEILRRAAVKRLAEEQGKNDPLANEKSPEEKIIQRYDRFHRSIGEADEEDIANYFLSAVAAAHDPHTDYMSTREMERFRSGMSNSLVGIGALLQAEDDGATKIMGIVVGGPADKQGELKLNDRIVGVDSLNKGDVTDIMYMKIDHVVEMIRGKVDTEVRLKVEPSGGAPGEVKFITIKRGRVDLKDELASAEVIEMLHETGKRRIGWLQLPSFYLDFEDGDPSVSADIQKLLTRLNKAQVDGLVLDLRRNGGGSLEEVRRITGFFVGRGPVVQIKDTIGRIESKEALFRRPLYDGPLVVVTDKSSASASEILAGALQDYNRAVIVGDSSTFGKGTVQQPMEIGRYFRFFEDNSRAGYLKVTIQKFYRVSGSSTQKLGVQPDIVLPSLTDALEIGEAYLKHPLDHDLIRKAPDLRPLDQKGLFLPVLRKRNEGRVKAIKDFQYIVEDVDRTKNRIKQNAVSLNRGKRETELAESEKRRKTRNVERRKRFAEMEARDKKQFKFFRLTLDDLKAEKLPEVDREKDAEAFMRRAKDKEDALDDTPLWPSGLDPVKRETLEIIGDLVDQRDKARTAGILPAEE
ncbi:MAG: carboxy terminal-processing peptidase [Roseibacillus sp.]|jgi:carboxyl-terminal processing protease|nr:carboxy terminal-processing peptidase [Roseibacillus sp.]HJM62567.1 carboxy terminal-processing peptidase [Roseibacillus sp.]|tara:strand:- start:8763 stop:10997 length:2235 start_codon:yes stop_codon:yes gene_type:complete